MIKRAAEEWAGLEEHLRLSRDTGTRETGICETMVGRRSVGDAAAGSGEADGLEEVLQQIVGVRDVLQAMCRVSVTRKSLKSAVREALLPIIEEHRDELFPEFAEFRRQMALAGPEAASEAAVQAARAVSAERADADRVTMDQFVDRFAGRLAEFESRIGRLTELESEVAAGFAQVTVEQDERLSTVEGDVRSRLEEFETAQAGQFARVEGQLGERMAALEASQVERLQGVSALRDEVSTLGERVTDLSRSSDEKLAGVVADVAGLEGRREADVTELKASLDALEASIPDTARAAASEVETRLRQEISDMVEQLSRRLDEVQSVLARIEEFVPRRELLESFDSRLGHLEGVFGRLEGAFGRLEGSVGHVAERVDDIHSVTPQVRSLRGEFDGLRSQVAEAHRALDAASSGVRDALSARLAELQGVLREGIMRWESDQSELQTRLTSLRDTLRDQLGELGAQVEKSRSSLWSKLGKKDPAVKLSPGDFDQLSTKLEGIIGGLESLIAKRRAGS